MRLFHFSETSGIERFEPRPAKSQTGRPPGREWLDGPLVWAIDEAHQPMYLFPRDCPRILAWAVEKTRAEDAARLGGTKVVAWIERAWLGRLNAAALYRYALPAETFEDLSDAGMWVSHHPVVPDVVERLDSLATRLATLEVDLRVLDSLVGLRGLWDTSLHVSGIRLRNAQGWK